MITDLGTTAAPRGAEQVKARTEKPPRRRRDRSSPRSNGTPPPARIPSRRSPRWIALGLVALCLGALLSYVIYTRVVTETAVVMMARTVYRGTTIQATDLTVTRLSGESVSQTVPASRLAGLVGQRAVFDLPQGAILTPGAIDDVLIPAQGRAVVGVKLATGRAPSALLLPASPVRLVALPAASGGQQATTDKLAGKSWDGIVLDQSPGPDGASIVINVDVPAEQAPSIAMLAAQDRLVVVRDPAR
jgi:SAF domain